jgi:hypothetical protein
MSAGGPGVTGDSGWMDPVYERRLQSTMVLDMDISVRENL